MDQPIIELSRVSKRFGSDKEHHDINDKRFEGKQFLAIDDASLQIQEGECVGFLGRNGSGKTTLLRIITGILQPDHGTVTVRGKILPFIELGVSFDDELTGKQNIYLCGSVLGLSRAEIDAHFDKIVEFSGLQDFMDVKLKKYSSGMEMRLAFASSVIVDHDILLVDEIVSVGDESFQQRSEAQFHRYKQEGKTIVLVSHSHQDLVALCDRIILIDKGKIVAQGNPEEIAHLYLSTVRKEDYEKTKQLVAEYEEEYKGLQTSIIEADEGVGIASGMLSRWKDSRARKRATALRRDEHVCLSRLRSAIDEFERFAYNRLKLLGEEITRLEDAKSDLEKQREGEERGIPSGFSKEELKKRTKGIHKKITLKVEERHEVLQDFNALLYKKLAYHGKKDSVRSLMKDLRADLLDVLESPADADKQRQYLEQVIRLLLYQFCNEEQPHRRARLMEDLDLVTIKPLEVIEDLNQRMKFWSDYLDEFTLIIREEKGKRVKSAILRHLKAFLDDDVTPVEALEFLFKYTRMMKRLTEYFGDIMEEEDYKDMLGHALRQRLTELQNRIMEQSSSGDNERLEEMLLKKKQLVDELVHLYDNNVDSQTTRKGWGTGEIIILNTSFLNESNEETSTLSTGKDIRIRIHFKASQSIESPRFGFALHHHTGLLLADSNNAHMSVKTKGDVKGEGYLYARIPSLPLLPGNYFLTVAVYNTQGNIPFDHQHEKWGFRVIDENNQHSSAIIPLECHWQAIQVTNMKAEDDLEGREQIDLVILE